MKFAGNDLLVNGKQDTEKKLLKSPITVQWIALSTDPMKFAISDRVRKLGYKLCQFSPIN